MTSVKLKFRPSPVEDRDGTLFYQIIHRRQVRQVYTGLHISYAEWDARRSAIVVPEKCGPGRGAFLAEAGDRIVSDMVRLKDIVERLERSGRPYSSDNVVAMFNRSEAEGGIVSFGRRIIEDMRRIGKLSMARRYEVALNSFLRFTDNKDVAWRDFNSTLVAGYEEFLRKRGLCRNSTSYYMRNLRSIVNRAQECDYEVPRSPFRHVYMGVDKTVKRAVTLRAICRIRDVDLSISPHLDFARNVFMFAFYTRGMSFVDIAYLKKSDVVNGVITYIRRKTSQQIQVRIEPQTRQIMERLGDCDSAYLLPLITSDAEDADRQYQNAYHRVNRNLQIVGRMLGFDAKLTLYVARHAWASIAHHNDVPLSTISKAMGHDSETTTQIYLSTLDTSVVDRANRKIMALMRNCGDG